jgi:hypothetical protein
MITRSNVDTAIRAEPREAMAEKPTTWILLTIGALALAAVAFASPAGARPNPYFRQCNSWCQLGDHACFAMCARIFRKTMNVVTPTRPPQAGPVTTHRIPVAGHRR